MAFFTSPTVTVTLSDAGPFRVGQTVTFAVQFLNRTRTGTRRVELACAAFERTVFVDLTSDDNASEVQARLGQPGQHRVDVAVLKHEDDRWQPSSILLDDSCPAPSLYVHPLPVVEFERRPKDGSALPGAKLELKVQATPAPVEALTVRLEAKDATVEPAELRFEAGRVDLRDVTLRLPATLTAQQKPTVRVVVGADATRGERATLELEPCLPEVRLAALGAAEPQPGSEVELRLTVDPKPRAEAVVEVGCSECELVAAEGAQLEAPARVRLPAGASEVTLRARIVDQPTRVRATVRLDAVSGCVATGDPVELPLPSDVEVVCQTHLLRGPFRPGTKVTLTFTVDRPPPETLSVPLSCKNCRASPAALTLPAGLAADTPLTVDLTLGGAGEAVVRWTSRGKRRAQAIPVRSAADPTGEADACAVANRPVVKSTLDAVKSWRDLFHEPLPLPQAAPGFPEVAKLLDDLRYASYEATLNSTRKSLFANYDLNSVATPVLDWVSGANNLTAEALVGLPLPPSSVAGAEKRLGEAVEQQQADARANYELADSLPGLGEGWVSRTFVVQHLQRRVRERGDHGACPLCGRGDAAGGQSGDPLVRLGSIKVEEALRQVVDALTAAESVRIDLLWRADPSAAGTPRDPDPGTLPKLAERAKSCREVVALLLPLMELEYQISRIEENVTPLLVLVESVGARLRVWRSAIEAAASPRRGGRAGVRGLLGDAVQWLEDHRTLRDPASAAAAPWGPKGERCRRTRVSRAGGKLEIEPLRPRGASGSAAAPRVSEHCYGARSSSDSASTQPVRTQILGVRNVAGLHFDTLAGVSDARVAADLAEARRARRRGESSQTLTALAAALRALLQATLDQADTAAAVEESNDLAEDRPKRWEGLLEDARWTVRHKRGTWGELTQVIDYYVTPQNAQRAERLLQQTYSAGKAMWEGAQQVGIVALPVAKLAASLTPHGAVVLAATSVGAGVLKRFGKQAVNAYKLGKRVYERGTEARYDQRKEELRQLKLAPPPLDLEARKERLQKELKLEQGTAEFWVRNTAFHLEDAAVSFDRLQWYALQAEQDFRANCERWQPDCDEVIGFLWSYYKLLKHAGRLAEYTDPLCEILATLLEKLLEYDTFWREAVEPTLQVLERKVQDPAFHGGNPDCPAPRNANVSRTTEQAPSGVRYVTERPGCVCYGPLDGKDPKDASPASPLPTATALDRIQRLEKRAKRALELSKQAESFGAVLRAQLKNELTAGK